MAGFDIETFRVNSERLWDSLLEMAEIGATEKGGVCRLALSEVDGRGRALLARWCREAGCTGYLTKPIDIDGLIETLAGVLGGERKRGSERSSPADAGKARDQRGRESAGARAPLVSRLAEKNPRLRATVEKFVHRLGGRLEAMEASWESGDFERLAKLAHWLKGAAGTVGFDAFTEPAQALELHARDGKRSGTERVIRELRGLAERIVVPGSAGMGAGPPLTSRLASRNPRLRATVEKFVNRLEGKLEAMELSWEANDLQELAKLAHWLKGAAGTVGFDVFTAPAETLELLAKEGKRDGIEEALRELRGFSERIVVADHRDT